VLRSAFEAATGMSSHHTAENKNRAARNKDCAGTVVVEVAIACVVVLMFILGIMDFSRMHYTQSRLQYAVSQSTRFAAIGSTLEDPNKPGKQMTREASIVHLIRKLSLLPDLQNSDIKLTSVSSVGKSAQGPGGPGDVVTVQATYHVPLVAPYLAPAFDGGRYTFTVATSFRNEEFGG
jgi:hypothetical protein